jgi:beta-phosphoglucomutase
MMSTCKGAIFDLDGVIVDTAKYHYLAWKRLAEQLGFVFTEQDNERLKGVSRMRSLEILLEVGGVTLTEEGKEEMAEKKNQWYVESLQSLDQSELLPGALEYLTLLQQNDIRIALGSASKNAPMILDKLHITNLFDAIIDGNCITKAKPDPEIFLKAAEAIHLAPSQCVVFEDSQAGIDAATVSGFGTVGVGSQSVLKGADRYVDSLAQML